MRHFIPDHIYRWLGPAIIIVIGMSVIVGNPIGQDMFCTATENCLATWVDALSGWAAALAAAITIGSLVQQAKAAQKQTDFQLGDAEPTFDAVQHTKRKNAVVLQIRNWNRRSMIIRRIRLVTVKRVSVLHMSFYAQRKKAPDRELIHDWTFTTGGTKKFEPALMIEGWIRREEEPPLLRISLAAHWYKDGEITDDWQEIPIEIQYELAGLRKVSRLKAHVHLASTAIADDDGMENIANDQAD